MFPALLPTVQTYQTGITKNHVTLQVCYKVW